MPTYPTCTFCGKNDSKPSKEHVIPKWLAREFPNVKWSITNRLTKYVRKGSKYVHIIAHHPCERCNNGWLHELEDLSSPILRPLMHGTPTTLSVRDQVIVGTWFFARAVMYDLHSEKQAPRPRYFGDNEHRQLMSTLSFNPAYRVFIGKYTGSEFFTIQEDHSGVSVAHQNDLQPLGDPIRAYALTFLINHLVLQIFCAKITEDLPFYQRDFRPFYAELGTSPNPVKWPPPLNFDDTLINKFAYRWSETPPPP